MDLEQMLFVLHYNLKFDRFSDIKKAVKVSGPTIYKWKKEPPVKPSLHVFCEFADYYNINYKISQIRKML